MNTDTPIRLSVQSIPSRTVARFWSLVSKDEKLDSCWIWTGSTSGGYGRLQFNLGERVRNEYAHRIAWIIANGTFDNRLDVLHKCDNPRCVNPNHLFLGSQLDNIRDMDAKGRRSRGKQHSVAVRGELCGHNKLTTPQVVEIRERCLRGEFQKALAVEFGVRQPCISRIVTKKNWAWL